MNVTDSRFSNLSPSMFHNEHYISEDDACMDFASFGRVDLPVIAQDPFEISDLLLGNPSLCSDIDNTKSLKSDFPMVTKLSPNTICEHSNATKVNCDASSVVSFGSESEVSSPMPSGDNDKLLHRACQLFPTNPAIISSAILADEDAIRRHEKLTQTANPNSKRACQRRSRPSEPYQLPINIALKHKASMEVLEILVDAGADTLEQKDGYEQCTSLNVALQTSPRNASIVELLLNSNAKCAMVPDRRQNYPLHMACSRGASIDVVRQLYSAYPNALSMKNFQRETPLDIAKRTSFCSEEVLDFLRSAAFD